MDASKSSITESTDPPFRDPITGAPDAHPIATGVGATTGGMVGAVAGAVAGPIGAVVGAAVGAVAGGLVGKSAGNVLAHEEAYWTERYRHEPYYLPPRTYADYAAAYRVACECYLRYPDRPFEEVEVELQSTYRSRAEPGGIDWAEARPASRAAWERLQRNRAGQVDH